MTQRSDRSNPPADASGAGAPRRLRVLFFVEGFTDIRFVVGLDQICDLTMVVPARQYVESGLRERIAASGRMVKVIEIAGGRTGFQARSLARLWRIARGFDVILAQEMLRGALNANLVGRVRGIPVVTTMNIAPVEYWRCRRRRRQIGALKAWAGELVIRFLLSVNGRLATRCVALGPYLSEIASRSCPRTALGLYYGVDTAAFRPANAAERMALRMKFDLPTDKFIVFLSSRISHEKDPETVLRAVAGARERGLDAILLNLGGGWREFLKLARRVPGSESWVIARPGVHPMTEVFDYFRAADVVAQASLAEGLGLALAESLACGTPVVATAVGGMAVFEDYVRMVGAGDSDAMARELLWIAANPEPARAQALRGREYVAREWSHEKAFRDLARVLADAARA
jgi:glycosyltransferase involved in cell wall biosynthesis